MAKSTVGTLAALIGVSLLALIAGHWIGYQDGVEATLNATAYLCEETTK